MKAEDKDFNNTLAERAGECEYFLFASLSCLSFPSSKLCLYCYSTDRAYKNFAFVKVFEAGHMVPYDQPLNSLEMFERWIEGVDFGDASWKPVHPPQ